MSVSVTWWGHATVTITLAGQRILTDPIFATRLAHLRRIGGPAPAPAAARADVVVVSHLHRDHLHLPTLVALAASTRIIAPHGAAAVVARTPKLAGRIEQVGPGDVVDVGNVRIEAVRAAHDGHRAPGSRYRGPALGFVMAERVWNQPGLATGARVWFAGDTGLFAGMTGIGPVDIAIVPVGGWGPTLGPEHLDPVQAAEAVRRVEAHDAVPVHYGTFWPAGLRRAHPGSFRRCFTEPGHRFADALASARPACRAHVIAAGQTVVLDGTDPLIESAGRR